MLCLIAVFMIYSGILFCFAFVKTTKCMAVQTWMVTDFTNTLYLLQQLH